MSKLIVSSTLLLQLINTLNSIQVDLRDFLRPFRSSATTPPAVSSWSQSHQTGGLMTRYTEIHFAHQTTQQALSNAPLVVCKLQDGPVELLPFLFLGSAVHSSRRETLAAAGITAVLNVSSTCPNFFEGEFEYLRLTVEDTLAADIRACFHTAIAFIGEALCS